MNSPNEKYLRQECEICAGMYIETENNSEWWVKCGECGHLRFCYEPMEHQLIYHADTAKYKMYAGKH